MDEYTQLTQAMATLETQRALLGDAVVDAALGPMRERLAALRPTVSESQRKQTTILFADISGFTALSETMDAEDIRDTIHALWELLDGVIQQHDGVIDKHMGDGLMALWGAQIAHEDAPERAIRAALAMQIALAATQTDQRHPLQMRIGINTGPVLVGVVGTTHEMTAMGDAVNLASRLEHAAPVGGVLISHDTYAVAVINPAQLASFATSLPRRAKTDLLDAEVARQFAQERQPTPWTPPPAVYHELRQRLVARDALMEMRQQARNQAHALAQWPVQIAAVSRQFQDLIGDLERRIAQLDRDVAATLQDGAWATSVTLLSSIPGLGPTTIVDAGGDPEFHALRHAGSRGGLCWVGADDLRIGDECAWTGADWPGRTRALAQSGVSGHVERGPA